VQVKLKLSHKGLILVSTLLAFELIFVAALAWLLNEAEQSALKEAHSKEIVGKTNHIFQLVFDAGQAASQFHKNMDNLSYAAAFEQSVTRLPAEVQGLKELVRDDPPYLELVKRIDRNCAILTRLVDRGVMLVQSGRQLQAMAFIKRAKPLFEMAKDGLVDDLHSLMQAQERIISESPVAQARARHQVQQLLFAGIVLNILLAIMLALFFTRGITGRLEVLAENTARLARGEPLRGLLPGSDEIARVDRVFHDMAEALAEAKRKEQAVMESLRASEERVRSIIENMLVGLVTVTPEGRIETVNPRMEQILGYTQAELAGKHIASLFAGPQSSDPETFFNLLKGKAMGHEFEQVARKKNGDSCAIEISLSEFNAREGPRLIANVLDVTERHEMERLKQEFVAMVSHDLRTPLTSIRTFLDMLTRGVYGALTDTGIQRSGMAERNISRLIALINDLLDIEKMEAGRLDMHLEPTAVEPVLARSLEAVRGFAEQHQVQIAVEPTSARVMADGDRLVQVLVNLLSNAVKFSPADSTVTVSAVETPKFVELRVADKGRGVPPEHRQAIFERFRQVQLSDSKQKGGTGLGLAICKAIVEQHGGTIGVESDPGAGSTFWFRIPTAAATAGASQVGSAEPAS